MAIHGEWKRIARRRKLYSHGDGQVSPRSGSPKLPLSPQLSTPFASSSSNSSSASTVGVSAASTSLSRSKDHPLFTLKQVTLIVERLWREREEQLREEYDRVLSEKLAG